MLHAVGVDVSLLDATAVLIAMVTLSQLPVGPSVGAAAVVLILGTNGVAATAAAGVLLTATGVAGALCFATWAALDRFHPRVPRIPAPEPAPEPVALADRVGEQVDLPRVRVAGEADQLVAAHGRERLDVAADRVRVGRRAAGDHVRVLAEERVVVLQVGVRRSASASSPSAK